MIRRRSVLGGLAGILASGFAPAAIGSGVLMPVRRIVVPSEAAVAERYGQMMDMIQSDAAQAISKAFSTGRLEIFDAAGTLLATMAMPEAEAGFFEAGSAKVLATGRAISARFSHPRGGYSVMNVGGTGEGAMITMDSTNIQTGQELRFAARIDRPAPR